MIRRPPRSTRTDTLFPDNDALPISRLSGMRPPNYPMMQLKMWLHWVFAERRCHRLPALLTLASKAGSRTVMAGPEQSTMGRWWRSEEHTSELQSLMRISYAVFCLKKKKQTTQHELHKHKHYSKY